MARNAGAALLAASRNRGVGPVYRNAQAGNPRKGLFYRVVDVNGQREHVYNNGTRIKVGMSPTLPQASSQPPRRRSPSPVVQGSSRTHVHMTGPGRGYGGGTAS